MAVGCHFLVQVKGNCRKLLNVIQLFTALNSPISCCEYQDDKHGRLVNRRVEVYVNDIDLHQGWEGITRFAKVRRWGTRNGKDFEEVSYYLLSKPINHANLVAEAIQQHWSIENKLHWNKDVNMGEDDMTLRDPRTAAMLAYCNNVAINILKRSGYRPIKDHLAKFANKVDKLSELFVEI